MRYTVIPRAVVLCGRHLLLVRSSPGLRSPSSGRWHLPGGEIRAGESPQRAIARMVAERSGLKVEVRGCLDALVRRGADPETGRQVPLLHLFFLCRPASDNAPDLLPDAAGTHTVDPTAGAAVEIAGDEPDNDDPEALQISPLGGAGWGWTDLVSGLGALKHDVVGEAVIEHIEALLGLPQRT